MSWEVHDRVNISDVEKAMFSFNECVWRLLFLLVLHIPRIGRVYYDITVKAFEHTGQPIIIGKIPTKKGLNCFFLFLDVSVFLWTLSQPTSQADRHEILIGMWQRSVSRR